MLYTDTLNKKKNVFNSVCGMVEYLPALVVAEVEVLIGEDVVEVEELIVELALMTWGTVLEMSHNHFQ